MDQNDQEKKNQLSTYAKFSGIGLQMLAIIGGGTYAGVKLDAYFENKNSLFTIICSLASVFIAMYYIIKQVSNLNK